MPRRPTISPHIALLVVTGLLASFPGLAAAHSLLLESEPTAGARLTAPPRHLILRFSNRIEKRLSRLRLLDARGEGRLLVLDGNDGPPDRLRALFPPLEPGAYTVQWQVLSTDGHLMRGSFNFRVAP